MSLNRYIPNTITCLNLVSGGIAIVHAFHDDFDMALIYIMIAAVFDFLDGLSARALNAYSDLGKELDSLADTVSFGLAPSLVFYNYLEGYMELEKYIAFLPLILAAFSALRLAKFNLDDRQTICFLGLPVPASALFAASFAAVCSHYPNVTNPIVGNSFFLPILSILLSALLVSEIPMFSLKLKSLKWKDNAERYLFLLIIIPVAAAVLYFRLHWTGIICAIFALYIVWNVLRFLFGKLFH